LKGNFGSTVSKKKKGTGIRLLLRGRFQKAIRDAVEKSLSRVEQRDAQIRDAVDDSSEGTAGRLHDEKFKLDFGDDGVEEEALDVFGKGDLAGDHLRGKDFLKEPSSRRRNPTQWTRHRQ
jgi:hypothetical protein